MHCFVNDLIGTQCLEPWDCSIGYPTYILFMTWNRKPQMYNSIRNTTDVPPSISIFWLEAEKPRMYRFPNQAPLPWFVPNHGTDTNVVSWTCCIRQR